MKFHQLKVNEHFRSDAYKDCVGIKIRLVKATCCNPSYNAKLICYEGPIPKETTILMDDNAEVEVVVQQIKAEEKELQQLSIVQPEQPKDERVGYKWHGNGPDPTLRGGGTFGGTKK